MHKKTYTQNYQITNLLVVNKRVVDFSESIFSVIESSVLNFRLIYSLNELGLSSREKLAETRWKSR